MSFNHTDAIEKAGLGARIGEGERRQRRTEWIESTDPTTGQSLGEFPKGDVDAAVEAARGAQLEWRKLRPAKRAAAMRRLAALCSEHAKDLTRIECLDVGMPRSIAKKLSVGALIKNLEYYAEWADKITGTTIPVADGTFDYTVREPLGVIASIIPWNTPLLMVGSKLGPALATGNTVILKPSEQASLSALKVAELAEAADLPHGVMQVLTGDAETGAALVRHPGIDKISFTGGGGIAREVLAAAADGLTPCALELGGKSPNILFADADLDRATFMGAMGVFGLSGQACAAGSRMLVAREIYDDVVERMKLGAAMLPIGDPLDPGTLMGPMISTAHRDKVREFVQNATARVVVEVPAPDTGAFMGPVVFADVEPDMAIWKQEIFGPVLCITAFDTEDEAIALANATEYGLAAGIWTKDGARAHRVANRVQAGNVWINHYGMLPINAGFGGTKNSGWGREGGPEALREYTQSKNVYMDLGA